MKDKTEELKKFFQKQNLLSRKCKKKKLGRLVLAAL